MATLHKKQFVFRADASNIIGAGHIMRCLTLADAISSQGGSCYFICREHKGDLREYIKYRGYDVHTLPFSEIILPIRNNHPTWLATTWEQDAQETITAITLRNVTPNWLFVDHYGIDHRWHHALRDHTHKIAVIDDLADRHYDCDLLIDQLCHRTSSDYSTLINSNTSLLLGGRYAILRPIFAQLRNAQLEKRKNIDSIKRVFISMGGTDLLNATHTALQVLKNSSITRGIDIDILSGQQSDHFQSIDKIADFPFNIHLHPVTTPIYELMTNADIAIGAGGSTAWERCCLGLPTFLITIAQNQHDAARGLVQHQAAVLLGDVDNFNMFYATDTFNNTIANIDHIKSLSKHAASICDGSGCTQIIEALTAITF